MDSLAPKIFLALTCNQSCLPCRFETVNNKKMHKLYVYPSEKTAGEPTQTASMCFPGLTLGFLLTGSQTGLLSLVSMTMTSTVAVETWSPSVAVTLMRYRSCSSRSNGRLTYSFHSPWTNPRANTPPLFPPTHTHAHTHTHTHTHKRLYRTVTHSIVCDNLSSNKILYRL